MERRRRLVGRRRTATGATSFRRPVLWYKMRSSSFTGSSSRSTFWPSNRPAQISARTSASVTLHRRISTRQRQSLLCGARRPHVASERAAGYHGRAGGTHIASQSPVSILSNIARQLSTSFRDCLNVVGKAGYVPNSA